MFLFPQVQMGHRTLQAVWYEDGYPDYDNDIPSMAVMIGGCEDEVFTDPERFLTRFGSFGAWLLVWKHDYTGSGTLTDKWLPMYERWL